MTETAKRRPGPRIEEVARVAGVSKSTVSRVINDEQYVSAKAREAVHAAIAQLGYSPNQAARALAGNRANAIALVVSEPTGRVLSDPFFAGVLRGVHSELAGRHTQLLLMMSQPSDTEDLVTYLSSGHVDGALLVSLHGEDPLVPMLAEIGLPVVSGGRPLGKTVPFVDADNFSGALEAARHLVSLGRKRIATVAGPKDMAVGADRLSGFKRGLSEGKVATDLVAHGDFTPESGARAMERLLRKAPDLDAVFVAADIMALGALQVLHAQGKRVPEDVAVVGFDDSVFAATATPPLTTIRQDVEELGRTMTWRLLAELAGEAGLPPSLLLPTSLVKRSSA
ncbi:LacI family DNA-binding transcriptional regulator [Lentzea sp.]|jgi:DNA-binding LacI/PurR family transcriptional regulator|uniref:LacI family DNA-binding transcriptional regulator n=1 Tax=Lentzea sp. TaxID=56099 RepID=UPI002CC8E88D|nr:LacI family DNA-binding transcriptional regulator [Lentzea sp.]HUQ60152.1 LacI family DNA-binding transcriptional regulator [Lentzea sp.]